MPSLINISANHSAVLCSTKSRYLSGSRGRWPSYVSSTRSMARAI